MFGRILTFCVLVTVTAMGMEAADPVGKVYKVLPHLLDRDGLHTRAPSLFERDAYQAYLRKNLEEVSGVRFDVLWKAKKTTTKRVQVILELRTKKRNSTDPVVISKEFKQGFFRKWSSVLYSGKMFQEGGMVTAWRLSLWDGDRLLDDQKSFLW